MIFEKVIKTIKEHDLIEQDDKVIVALSGGPDSVCLLHILNRLKEDLNLEIYAAHLNHQIRGLEAQKDAYYVAQLCESMGITYFIRSIDVPEYCKRKGFSIEEGARKLRYEMFEEIKDKTKSNKVAIGQNLNDQAETVMMRIMRGTGLKGLKGIDYIRNGDIIRPILDISRSEIEEYCDKYDLKPRIDKTNLESIYTRNKIRLELLPYMKDNFNENVIESIVRMSSSLKNDNDYIETNANEIFIDITNINDKVVEIDIDKYKKLHIAMKSRIVRKAIESIYGSTKNIEQKHIDDVFELESDDKIDKQINLPNGIFVYRKEKKFILTTEEIIIEDIKFCYNIPSNGYKKIKEIGIIVETQTANINSYRGSKSNKDTKVFDLNKIKGGLVVRNKEDGDKIKLSVGSKKIKDLFIDLKIPRENRSKVPVIQDEQGILLVGDYRVSEEYKVDQTTKEVLKVTFKKL